MPPSHSTRARLRSGTVLLAAASTLASGPVLGFSLYATAGASALEGSGSPLTAVVTGANRGLGLALARKMSVLGHHVVLTSRDEQMGKAAAQAVRAAGFGPVSFCPLDVSSPASVCSFPDRRRRRGGTFGDRVDVLLLNAGVCLAGSSRQVLEETLAANFHGPLAVLEACLPSMHEGGGGSAVVVSSGDGELCCLSSRPRRLLQEASSLEEVRAAVDAIVRSHNPEEEEDRGEELAFGPTPAYSLSKAAVNAAVRVAGPQLAVTHGVRLVAVCPGDVRTRMCSVGGGGAEGGGEAGGGGEGALSPEEAAGPVVDLALRAADFPGGRFYRDLREIPW